MPRDARDALVTMFEKAVPSSLELQRKIYKKPIPTTDLQLKTNLHNLFTSLLTTTPIN